MSFAQLYRLGRLCLSLIEKDAIILATFGIDAAAKTLIEDLVDQSGDFPSDEELLGDAMSAREDRDKTQDMIKECIRSIMSRVKERYGEKSATYRKFGTKRLSAMTDLKLSECASLVTTMAQIYLSELSEKGLTQQMIDDLIALNATFQQQIIITIKAEKARDEATENRIVLGNTLYKKITEVFNYGKTYWASRNGARYKEYVIYKSKKSKINKELEE